MPSHTCTSAFNWGLMTYGMRGAPGLYNTYAYYLGDNAGMVFTATRRFCCQ